MKVIDLLNKIASGEEIPKRIKIKDYPYDYPYYWDSEINTYVEDNSKEDVWGELDYSYLVVCNMLNNYVEILEGDKE